LLLASRFDQNVSSAKAAAPEDKAATKLGSDRGSAETTGSAEGIELANHQAGPEFIAVDDRFVYWSNFEDDKVQKVSKDGSGHPREVGRSDPGENKSLAVDASGVYWGGRSLHARLASSEMARHFDVNSTLAYNVNLVGERVYWVDYARDVQLKSMRRDGTDIRAIGQADKRDFIVATDGRFAFIGRFEPDADDAGRIEVVPIGGGASTVFATTRFLWKIVLDDDFVYWLEGRNSGEIRKQSRKTAGPSVSLTKGFTIARPQSLSADQKALYWTELGTGTGQGAIGRVSKSGVDARHLAEHQVVPQALTTDETFVYWVNYGPTKNGSVRKIAK
jgi:hypothetical protein